MRTALEDFTSNKRKMPMIQSDKKSKQRESEVLQITTENSENIFSLHPLGRQNAVPPPKVRDDRKTPTPKTNTHR